MKNETDHPQSFSTVQTEPDAQLVLPDLRKYVDFWQLRKRCNSDGSSPAYSTALPPDRGLGRCPDGEEAQRESECEESAAGHEHQRIVMSRARTQGVLPIRCTGARCGRRAGHFIYGTPE